jgi:hypothetical protein
MKKIIIIVVVIMLSCVSCQQKSSDSLDVEVSSYAQQLFLNKNIYVGDASANQKILNLLNITEEFGNYSVELKTDQKPYWIKLNFEDYVSDRDQFDAQMIDKAYLILALINNVEEVQCSYPYIDNAQEVLITLYITQKQATDALGKDIKSFAESEELIQQLLTQLNLDNTVHDQSTTQEHALTTYEQLENYLWQEAQAVFEPYYELIAYQISEYEEVVVEDGVEAIFYYNIIHKNYDKDPDTVGYIKAAKENQDPHYQTLYDEYLAPKDMNMEIKAVIDKEGVISLYMDSNPHEEREWVRFSMEDSILSN